MTLVLIIIKKKPMDKGFVRLLKMEVAKFINEHDILDTAGHPWTRQIILCRSHLHNVRLSLIHNM